jgi:hypothetical protein
MIVKTFEQELKDLLARYIARIVFEYDVNYKYHNVKVINDNEEVLFESENSKERITIFNDIDIKDYTDKEKEVILKDFSNKLLSNIKDIPPEFAKILYDNFWELI